MPYGAGPYPIEGWHAEKCFGRIVGIYQPLMTGIDIGGALVPDSILRR